MSTIISTIQAIVRQEMSRLYTTELGVVESVFPHSAESDQDNYGCDVRLKNSGLLLRGVPIATGHIGTVAAPNVGDLVALAFSRGNVNQPIMLGRLYNDEDRPPLSTTDEVVFRLPLAEPDDKTVMAALRNHQDTSPPREVLLEMPPKITLRITDGTVRVTAGKTEMHLDQPGGSGGTVTVFAGRSRLTINQDGDVSVEAAGSMSVEATRDLTLQGQNVAVKALQGVSIEAGTQSTLKGNLGATVDGGLSATLRGATVSINGLTAFSP